MPTNTAAWLGARRAELVVGPAPYPRPREDEIVVRNRAVAVNPLDWILQDVGSMVFPWIRYPFVLGADLAGEVVEVGAGVTRFRVGERVLAHAVGTDRKRNSSAEGAFQHYTVVLARPASPIPDLMPYEEAAVLPLGLSTAACGLFQKDQLALRHPCATPVPVGQTVLIWGGATSVGSNAIQLAVAAGYEVVATASRRNAEYVMGLGATQVLDRSSPTVIGAVIEALTNRTVAGALAIGTGSTRACADVLDASVGTRFVSTASTPVSFGGLSREGGASGQLAVLLLRLLASTVSTRVRLRSRRIRTNSIFGSTLMDNEVGRVIYEDFLPQALADGRYVTAPEPFVVGRGLGYVQEGLDTHKRGMSAQKVVISL